MIFDRSIFWSEICLFEHNFTARKAYFAAKNLATLGTIHRPKARKEPPRCLLVLFFEQDSLFLPRYSWAFINGGLVGLLRLADSLSPCSRLLRILALRLE